MIDPTAWLRGNWARVRHLCSGTGVLMLALAMPIGHAAEDAYLQMLNTEVAKVEGAATDTETVNARVLSDRSAPQATAASREAFEELLREQHVGTYTFYRKLPERGRAEIFADYSGGASMEALRGKIVDRFLHP